MILFILTLNLIVSWFNAWSIGRSIAEVKAAGGIRKIVSWFVTAFSAYGFTWTYVCIVTFIIQIFFKSQPKFSDIILSFGYLGIILSSIGLYLALALQLWAYFWKRSVFFTDAIFNLNIAGYIYEKYKTLSIIPITIKNIIKSLMISGEDEAPLLAIVITFIIITIFSGVLTTMCIIRSTVKNYAIRMI